MNRYLNQWCYHYWSIVYFYIILIDTAYLFYSVYTDKIIEKCGSSKNVINGRCWIQLRCFVGHNLSKNWNISEINLFFFPEQYCWLMENWIKERILNISLFDRSMRTFFCYFEYHKIYLIERKQPWTMLLH